MNHEEWSAEHDRLADNRRAVAFQMVGIVSAMVQFHDMKLDLSTADWDSMRGKLQQYDAADKALDAFWEAHPHCDLLPNPEEEEVEP